MSVVEVAVPVPLRQRFHYRLKPTDVGRAGPGARVLVQFGPRALVGYVVAVDTQPPEGVKLSTVREVLDPPDAPTFEPALLGLLTWMAEYYRAPIGEVLRAGHPAGINAKGVPGLALTAAGRAAAEAGEQGATGQSLGWLARQGGEGPVDAIQPPLNPGQIKRLLDDGLAVRTSVLAAPRVDVRTERAVRAVAPAPVEGRGPGGRPLKRDQIHAWLVGKGAVLTRDVREAFPNATTHLKQLIDEGALAEEAVEVLRDPFFGEPVARDTPPTLNAGQRRAVAAIAGDGFKAFLLHGVTGSGKTEVYLHAIEQALAAGRGALVLVPEIALTPQLVRRFRARLGDAIAVLHSGLSDGARYDQWRRLKRGEVRVAIGARSALFAPVPDLGLIVVDEAHDGSYKQGEGVRYHARDMALVRGLRQKARVVLGTATPSLETELNVQRGKLARLALTERPTGATLPTVQIVDLRIHRPPDDDAPFLSRPLREALAETLARGEQAILFLNKRGYASAVHCEGCGFVLECDACDVAMTWHARRQHLRCHYCDRIRARPPRCPHCGEDKLAPVGRGTEKVEDALRGLFPQARIGRMDRDVITTTRALRTLLTQIRKREIDILVGTQMVTKGHDFPGVTLVGVLAADAGLNFPDFRAAERTFQLLTQVAGRAGRADKPGRVLVQTYDPAVPALEALVDHDHARFATVELPRRRDMGYPPFTHAAQVRVDGKNARAVEAMAKRLGQAAARAGANTGGTRLQGPAPLPLAVLRDRVRWGLFLTAERRDRLRTLLDAIEAATPDRTGDVRVVVDVDPQDFL